MIIQRYFYAFILFLLLNLLFCAHIQPPTGGPEDKSGPTVKYISPSMGSVNVPTNVKITVVFSEWIKLSLKGKGVTIFPSVPLKVKVKANRLEIKPTEPLKDSTTYHLVITTVLQDLHNNSLAAPINLTFSTGSTLDSGFLTGCVIDETELNVQPIVSLFNITSQPKDSIFFGEAAYITQADTNGLFSFENIRCGSYYVVAFVDKNSDSKIQPLEKIYIPEDSVIKIEGNTKNIVLYWSDMDTSRQHVASVKKINDSTLFGLWKKRWDTLSYSQPPLFKVCQVSDTEKVVGIDKYEIDFSSLRFFLYLKNRLLPQRYRLFCYLKSILDTTLQVDTLEIDSISEIDTIPPIFLKFLVDSTLPLRPQISLIWSELIYFRDSLIMADSLGDTVLIIGNKELRDTSLFKTTRALLPGRRYTITILSSYGRDIAGNQLRSKDTTDTIKKIFIKTIEPDSIATSLSGGSKCLPQHQKRKWLFKYLKKELSVISKDISGNFIFDSIAAGKGRILTFIDYNDNNKIDRGNLLPFVAPEPYLLFPDTIEARARWDIEGIV
ncbi:MAG: Ig-like domain-containing domain, partial [Chitinispirillaceae bacterium]|nr:Ig-like domain-containing domain [Chitinispirillaceae bacterium]